MTERREDLNFGIHDGWWPSGWLHVLPRSQTFFLIMMMSSAAMNRLHGTLEDVVRTLYGGEIKGAFAGVGDDFDAPLQWLEPEDLENAETEQERAEFRSDAEAQQACTESIFQEAGIPMPTTLRELADVMIRLGIASHSPEGWSMPERLPLPEESLPLPAELDAKLRDLRRQQAAEPFEQDLIRYLTENQGYPDQLSTSLERLAKVVDLKIEDVRTGLAMLVEVGDVHLYRGESKAEIAVQDLADHARFSLVPDWDHFNEHRMTIVRSHLGER